ncbi:hypothetical protein, partial [Akkermansia sp.]|uniref:hypothetical protein n=1 Tax=Akkermansia sp. TaxID=1872421 RepID=UPI003AB154B6
MLHIVLRFNPKSMLKGGCAATPPFPACMSGNVLVHALFSDGEVALKVAAAYYEPYKKIYNG